MHLKRLEMVGFKSFAEKTRLEFEPGIIAIVGPNGCGKSNVVDAIRWCLGEMSAKSLRSKILLDVIFNGSVNRAPTHLAEVSLTFDNSQNRLPIDYSEVTISRRLFRSGESEYFLNKTQCRLKDIRELFLDTGIGEEGDSIMEQGRVEYVLNAKPEDRRELFEEAAGVSKYKARREEALRKMERTQLDLDRLSDVIAMTKEQMDRIEAAVRKARQYQKLQEDLKNMEIAHWLWEEGQLDAQRDVLKTETKSLENALQSTVTRLDQREAELAELRWSETQLGEKLVSLNRELSAMDGNIGLAEQKQTTAREREEEIRNREGLLEDEITRGQTRLSEIDKSLEEAKNFLQVEKTADKETNRVFRQQEEKHSSLTRRQEEAENRAKNLQDALWNNNQETTHLHNAIASQRSLETRLDTELKALQKDLAKAEERNRSLEEPLTQFDQNVQRREAAQERLEQVAQQARRTWETVQEDIVAAVKLFEETQTTFFQAKARLDALEAQTKGDIYAQGAQTLLTAGLPGIQGPLGKLVSASPADEPVVRHILDAHLNDLVADTLEDAQKALDHLSSVDKGRARLWVLERLPQLDVRPVTVSGMQRPVFDMAKTDPKYQPVVKLLLGRWIVAGNKLYGEGVLEGGAELTSHVLSDLWSAEQLQEEVSRFSVTLDSLTQQKLFHDERLRTTAAAWEQARQAAGAARLENDIFRREREKLIADRRIQEEEAAVIKTEIQKLNEERAQVEQAVADHTEKLRGAAAEETRLREEWKSLQAALENTRAETAASAADLAVTRERASNQQERLRWRAEQVSSLEEEQKGITTSLESKTQERATSRQRIEEQKAVQNDSQAAIHTLLEKRKTIDSDLEAVHAERQVLHERLHQAQAALTELKEENESLRSQLQEKRLQLSHMEFRRESIESQMKEKYAITALEAQEKHGVPTEAVATDTLERLRRRVESLGAVNLAAPEEHAQLEERYNFLLSQQQDLLKAKEDLMQTIQKINSTTRQSFRETFDKVRENFKVIYGQLFQGGEADIRLTDESDLMNTGIEIFAQPPGKKLQNITLLSGGEKALTAVSLLFAFFMVRPAPFCVLDEVDAPLDEANVTRFITLIKAFTHQSQFLMITHNKRTMETADVLYGVTMETLGVSKVLSTRLKQDNQRHDTLSPEAVIAGGSRKESPGDATA